MTVSFSINTFSWTIEFTNNESLLLVNNKVCKGSIVYKTRTIYIDNRISLDSVRRALGHELAHAFMYDTQVNCVMPYDEEDICEFVALYNQKIYKIIEKVLRKFKQSLK